MTGRAQQAIQALSDPELADLWRRVHGARAMGALAVAEAELIRRARALAERAAQRARKGSPVSTGEQEGQKPLDVEKAA